MKKLLLLDLDRTIFDTATFMRVLWTALAAEYNADYDREMARVPSFYRAVGDYRYYDLQLHIQEGLGENADEAMRAVSPILTQQDFAFADLSELGTWLAHPDYEVRVLTFGPEWVQRWKLVFMPMVKDVPIDITLEPKEAYIAREFAGRTGFLVDDRLTHSLPDGFTEMYITRESTIQNSQEDGIIYINSLTQVREYL